MVVVVAVPRVVAGVAEVPRVRLTAVPAAAAFARADDCEGLV